MEGELQRCDLCTCSQGQKMALGPVQFNMDLVWGQEWEI